MRSRLGCHIIRLAIGLLRFSVLLPPTDSGLPAPPGKSWCAMRRVRVPKRGPTAYMGGHAGSRLSQSKRAISRTGLPNPTLFVAAVLMIVASVFFAAMAGLIRYGSEDLHPFQLAFLRSAFGLLFMLPWLMKSGIGILRTDRIGLITIRGLVAAAAMFSFFWALSVKCRSPKRSHSLLPHPSS